MTENQETAESLLDYSGRLKTAGMDLDNSVIAARFNGGQFLILENGGENAEVLTRVELLRRHPAVYGIFRRSRKVSAVIRGASKFCSVAAEAGGRIPPVLDDMAQILGVYVKHCSPFNTFRLLRITGGNGACLTGPSKGLAPGLLAVGADLRTAYTAALVIEKAAQVHVQAGQLGDAKPLPLIEAMLMHFAYKLAYSKKAAAVKHQSVSDIDRKIDQDELKLRREIISLGNRLVESNLVQGTWGNISVRLDEDYMLCTPSGMDYSTINEYDIVRVNISTLEYEGAVKPTGEKSFHAALLAAHPDVSCIIHSHPSNCSVFAAAHKQIIPFDLESAALLGGEIRLAEYGLPSSKRLSDNVVSAIRENRACVMENHGMVVCGTDMEDAFAKCRAAEKSAEEQLKSLEKEKIIV